MTRINKVYEQLKRSPCTREELPYAIKGTMGLIYRTRIRILRVAGNRSNKSDYGRFKTVYYLEGDEDRAVHVFAEVNADVLAQLDFSHNTAIDSGLSKDIAQKLRAAIL